MPKQKKISTVHLTFRYGLLGTRKIQLFTPQIIDAIIIRRTEAT